MLLNLRAVASMLAFAAAAAAAAAPPPPPFLHPLFTDHAVLQREMRLPVWGWTVPGATVTIELAGSRAEAVADPAGRWQATLPALAAGGPYEMTVDGPQRATVRDILLGDVWLCSGQSNMQWPLSLTQDAEREIAAAGQPRLRLFTVPTVTATEPAAVVDASWDVCAPATAADFSAVAYFFGSHLVRERGVPIGLIDASWGGTCAETWTSAEALAAHLPELRPELVALATYRDRVAAGAYDFDRELTDWWAAVDRGGAAGWAAPEFDDADWPLMDLPRVWEERGLPDFDGLVWFRCGFDLPAEGAGRDAVLELGPIDDIDETWLNGRRLGGTAGWDLPRSYAVPGELLRPGRNLLAVRVMDVIGGGGLHGRPEQLALVQDERRLSLAGAWRYRVSAPLSQTGYPPKRLESDPNTPSTLFNGMISPLLPFPIKGAIWYQGECNVDRHDRYAHLLTTLVADWRSRFGVGDFPFLIVQLAAYMPPDDEPRDDPWPNLREAQRRVAATVPATALVATIDIGDALDIHPRNKQEVGRRLGLAARAVAYGEEISRAGPVFRSLEVRGREVRLSFETSAGLVLRGGGGFAVCGEDGRWAWAEARVEGDDAVVGSPLVERPVAVRYGWSNNPLVSLFDREGLPAEPFQADEAR